MCLFVHVEQDIAQSPGVCTIYGPRHQMSPPEKLSNQGVLVQLELNNIASLTSIQFQHEQGAIGSQACGRIFGILCTRLKG